MQARKRARVKSRQEQVLRCVAGSASGEELDVDKVFSWHNRSFIELIRNKEAGSNEVSEVLKSYFPRFVQEGLAHRLLPDWRTTLPTTGMSAAGRLNVYFKALNSRLRYERSSKEWWKDLLLIEWARSCCLLGPREELAVLKNRCLRIQDGPLSSRQRHCVIDNLVFIRLKTNVLYLIPDHVPLESSADMKSARDMFWAYFDLDAREVRYLRFRSLQELRFALGLDST